jgi:hypothetical protein
MWAESFLKSRNNTYPFTVPLKVVEKNKVDAARFSPFWNEIIRNLREEDYITNLLVMGPAISFLVSSFVYTSYLIPACCFDIVLFV